MAGFFVFIFVIALIALPISLLKPGIFSRFFQATRTKNALILFSILFVSFIMIGLTAPKPVEEETKAGGIETPVEEKEVENPTLPPQEQITLAPTATPTPTNSPTPTKKPTAVPTKIVVPTATPKSIVYPTSTPIPQPVINSGGEWPCNCSKTCTQISSCAEAQYLLNSCGCSARDADDDGIACDSSPLNCQN